MTRWRCISCGNIAEQDDLLQARNPFDPDTVLTGCPECRAVWDTEGEALCDEPNCERPASCGWPSPEGEYRQTCYAHMEQYARLQSDDTLSLRATPMTARSS